MKNMLSKTLNIETTKYGTMGGRDSSVGKLSTSQAQL